MRQEVCSATASRHSAARRCHSVSSLARPTRRSSLDRPYQEPQDCRATGVPAYIEGGRFLTDPNLDEHNQIAQHTTAERQTTS